MEKIEALLGEMRDELRRMRMRQEKGLPTMLTYEHAAKELSMSMSKLRGLIRDGGIAVCEIGKKKYVPRLELERLERTAKTTTGEAPSRRRARRLPPPPPAGGLTEAEKVRAALRKRG